jgi:pyranose oxidase
MTANRNVDVFIAGSGPIGCTFARLLRASGRSVLLADSGPAMSKYPGEHLKNAVAWQRDIDKFTPIVQGLLYQFSTPPRPGHTLTLDPISFRTGAESASVRGSNNPRQDPYKNLPSAAQGFAVGGMFVHWTNSTPRQHAIERMTFFSAEEWDYLYNCAEALFNVRSDAFRNGIRQQIIKKHLIKMYRHRLPDDYLPDDMPMGAERRSDNDEFVYYTGSDTVLGPLAIQSFDKTFEILPEHRVKQLVAKGSRITHAVVDDMVRGSRFNVFADQFIVACGPVLTPQLLWASNVRPKALGAYLHEHTFTFTQIVLRSEIIEEIQSAAPQRVATDPDPIPIPMSDPPPMLRVPVSEDRHWHTQVHRDSFGFNGVPPDVDSRLIVDIRSFGMVEPEERNRVTFESDIFDKFGMPQPTFDYVLGDAACRRAHEMMGDTVDIAQELGGFLTGSEPRFLPPGASLHVMGTTRMGAKDDGTSVVDLDSKVWGFDNLRLGGTGLLATKNACNPTLTAAALAVRSAAGMVGERPTPSALGMGEEYRRLRGLR